MIWEVNAGVKIDELIKVVSDHVGTEWRPLARALKFVETDVQAIAHDNALSLKEQIYQLFYQWQRKEGNYATSEVLLKGLIEANFDEILKELQSKGLIQPTVGGHPIQETTTVTAVPERPKLMGLDEDAEDVEVDDAKLVSKPSPRSPEEEKRHRIRIKRLTRLSSDEIGEGPFEEGHMVHVKSMGYGVIKWLGQRNKGLIAGIEFEEHVLGGKNGVLDGTKYFECDPGFGLFLPYKMLRSDTRFLTTPISPLKGTSPVDSPAIDSPTAIQSNGASSTAEDSPIPTTDTEPVKPLIFRIPNDRAGLVIGKDGKNILEVERATNTVIKVDPRSVSLMGMGDNRYVTIIGSTENCKNALLMITQRLQRRVSMHTAASETIQVPENMVGRIIGKNGVTVNGIKSLSGAQDIKFSERPVGMQGLLSCERDCTITGSHDEIEKAKKLIEQVLCGEDIITNACLEALLLKLNMRLEDEQSGCVLS